LINYRTIADLNQLIHENVYKLPPGIEVVAGVHRSGLLAANILAAHLNLPVISFRNLWETSWIYAGYRSYLDETDQNTYLDAPRKVLVVEDATNSGATLHREQTKYQRNFQGRKPHDLTYLTIYPAEKDIQGIDMHFEVLPGPRMFEWNWLNHHLMGRSCVDIDGVLCHDPDEHHDYDEHVSGKQYRKFIETAKPLFIPKRKIARIVTSRLTKWRQLTEEWLTKHGVEYGSLSMMPCKDPEERKEYGHAKFKAECYTESPECPVFFESDPEQAQEIFDRTGRPVFCVATKKLLQKA
jgi:uncharacterized HAD superfamily protein